MWTGTRPNGIGPAGGTVLSALRSTVDGMKSEDGTYQVTPEELAAFRDSGHSHWWMNADGSTDVYTDSNDRDQRTTNWPIYLTNNSPEWFAQWDGDFARACEQLNAALAKNIEKLEAEGQWPIPEP